ncbi:MAG TPA: hypothetical protein VHG93_21560 [Longimicrobium sp.]|nr:hypothetical protein [Longimicrobium sp.]
MLPAFTTSTAASTPCAWMLRRHAAMVPAPWSAGTVTETRTK